MTPEEAKKLLENIQKYTVNMGVGSGTFMQMKNVHKLLEAARIVERERCAELLNEYDCVCGRLLGGGKHGNSYLQQKILSPNPNIV